MQHFDGLRRFGIQNEMIAERLHCQRCDLFANRRTLRPAGGHRQRVYPHLLRHSIATILLDSGLVPIDQVQNFSVTCSSPPLNLRGNRPRYRPSSL
jgi:hypothetical protein